MRLQDSSFIGPSHEILEGDFLGIRESLYYKVPENSRPAWRVVCQAIEQRKLLLVIGLSFFFREKSLEITLTGFELPDTLVHPLSFSSNATQALAQIRSDIAHGESLLGRRKQC
jgi:hypothetical protein